MRRIDNETIAAIELFNSIIMVNDNDNICGLFSNRCQIRFIYKSIKKTQHATIIG